MNIDLHSVQQGDKYVEHKISPDSLKLINNSIIIEKNEAMIRLSFRNDLHLLTKFLFYCM